MGSPSSTGGGVPPGFRFHPTDEELLHFYLKKKISFQKFDMDVIREIDLNKIEPWDLQERCKIGSTPQNEWYLFSHKDRKYPTGSRTNRATNAGFWKATGRDKCIRNSFKKIGMRKTLVFYHGRAPHGQKTDWIMHEYRLEDADTDPQATHEDGWVVCRVFKKKNLFKVVGNSNNSSDQGGVHNSTGRIMMLGDHGHRQFNNMSSATATAANNWIQYSRSPANFTHLRDPVTTNHQYFPPDHHGNDLNYISHMNQINNNASSITLSRYPQYPPHPHDDQLEAHNFISDNNNDHNLIMKPLMLSNSTSTYEHHHLTAPGPPIIGTTHAMDECDQSSDHQVVNAVRSDDDDDDDDDHNNLNEWDRLAIPLTDSSHHQHNPTNLSEEANPTTSSTNQINHLSLRSEVNFWGYGK